jgi:hypothetical protein
MYILRNRHSMHKNVVSGIEETHSQLKVFHLLLCIPEDENKLQKYFRYSR